MTSKLNAWNCGQHDSETCYIDANVDIKGGDQRNGEVIGEK